MSNITQYGLIILGNSGVGKSFLANILIGRDVFVHQFEATSVTQSTESVEVKIGSYTFTIFNMPGLIEAQQARIDLNKQEIGKAFTQRPNSIIMFVFGQRNGRLLDQDIVAFNAMHKSYSFQPESLVLVVNGVPKSRPNDYEETTMALLQQRLECVNVNNNNLCFTDFINVDNDNEKQALNSQILPFATKFTPKTHEKKQDIKTVNVELKVKEKEIKEAQAQLEAKREELQKQLEEQQRIAKQCIAEQQAEQFRLKEQQRLKEEQRLAMIAAQEAERKRLHDLQASGFGHHRHHHRHHHGHHDHPHPHGHHDHPHPHGHHDHPHPHRHHHHSPDHPCHHHRRPCPHHRQ